MPNTDVGFSALEAIASTLRTASSDLESMTNPPEPPEAGDATGVLAALLSHVSLSIDGAVTGLAASGDAVAGSRDLFQQTEDANRDAFQG
jgi:hypothetical protein